VDNVALWIVSQGDLNRDRRVDATDLAVFASQWMQQGPGLAADLNGDGRVDYHDFALFSQDWSGSP
jgi:hypothetical protein